jgi:hypothetical protein
VLLSVAIDRFGDISFVTIVLFKLALHSFTDVDHQPGCERDNLDD